MTPQQHVTAEFQQRFGAAPTFVVRAPGRVNLIGEHTDYNDGFVLPMAIDRAAWIALRPRADDRVIAHSLDFNETVEFSLTGLRKNKQQWAEYVKGIAWALQEAGHKLRGWEGIVAGDVPIGAGLSSSAALEMATARAFAAVTGFPWDAAAMAKLGQRAENKWVGVNCGIMDQMISAAGKAGHALLIDCRSLATELVPLRAGTVIVVLDTNTRRGLVDSAYNERRQQCEQAAAYFQVRALRDVGVVQFAACAEGLDPVTRRRARHVVGENERTRAAAKAMHAGDAVRLGTLMNESHDSLRDDFEVTNTELNVMVECARRAPGCLGARMTGAGFGGCAMALVKADLAKTFVTEVAATYAKAAQRQPAVYVCRATNGAEVVARQ
jgi:galactokinase